MINEGTTKNKEINEESKTAISRPAKPIKKPNIPNSNFIAIKNLSPSKSNENMMPGHLTKKAEKILKTI